MKVVNLLEVSKAVEEQTVNGQVVLHLNTPRATKWVTTNGHCYPDPTSMVNQLIVSVNQLAVATGENLAGQYVRCVYQTGRNWYEIIVLQDGVLTMDCWMPNMEVEHFLGFSGQLLSRLSNPIPTEKNPTPTQTHWDVYSVMHLDAARLGLPDGPRESNRSMELWGVFEHVDADPDAKDGPIPFNVAVSLQQGIYFTTLEDATTFQQARHGWAADQFKKDKPVTPRAYSYWELQRTTATQEEEAA